MSSVPAHWDAVARAVQIRDSLGNQETLIIGSGDVRDIADSSNRRVSVATLRNHAGPGNIR